MNLLNYLGEYNNIIFNELLILFDMDKEQNIPTLYNTFIVLLSSIILLLIASYEEKRRDRILWGGLALIFLYIGVDDFTTFHEGIYHNLVPDYQGTGFLKYGWVIPYSIIILIIGILYIKHVFRIQKQVRNKIILAGAIYVTGGFVFEMIGGYVLDNGYLYLALISRTIEESGEMIGILIFINALVQYIKLKNKIISIDL